MITQLCLLFLITLKLLEIDSINTCDRIYNGDSGILKLDNDFSGWYKLKVGVWLPPDTNKTANITSLSNVDDLSSIENIEYLLNIPKHSKLLNVTLNENVICITDLDENETGIFVLLQNLMTIKQARLNSKECGTKSPVNPFFALLPPIEAPWIVAIYANQINGKYEYGCAGNLITDRHVLSIAQCFSGKVPRENFAVAMGSSTLVNWATRAVIRGIRKIEIHEDYKFPASANIALLLLDQPVAFTNKLRPICIHFNRLYNPSESGLFSGWGASESGKELLNIRHLPLSLISKEDCLRLDPVYFQLNSNRSFCVGASKASKGKSPCQGDHGGGLAVDNLKSWNLKGILSIIPLTKGQCNSDLYTVFIDVPKFKEWIIKKIDTSY